ncbi:aldehyde dehydrogenase family protein [Microbacterium sp.]|uniref:aldehyde dehydrogenase family protein n=1 Tax=Microbacterium sp. TaxID=51671 RepID=UPI002811DF5D|nr:aldehyde dehydrogenase family protein [Microbacterium sp.]
MTGAMMTAETLFDAWRVEIGTADSSTVHNPATGEAIAAYRNASPSDVDDVVAVAKDAFDSWGRTTPSERSSLLLRLADRLEETVADFAAIESRNTGKPASHAVAEVAGNIDFVRFIAGAARVSHGLGGGEYVLGRTSAVHREPIGVVGLITPWNYPLMEAIWKVIPALAAGNTVVVKPSELTPETTIRLVELAQETLPAGVLNLILGDGRAGAALVEHPDVRMVSLTGDTSTGRKVAAAGAASLTRIHLELGGKAAVMVFADAPITEVAERLAPGAYVNAGQNCTAPCRIIVEASAYDEFVAAYCAAVASLSAGAPEEDADLGPLISQRQLDRVSGFVERARAAGATVPVGGARIDRPGYFYAPTVVLDPAQDSEIIQNEVFGPVVTIQAAESEAEMLEMANGVQYGLAASVWTSSLDRSLRLSRALTFGTVWVNEHDVLANEMPFGGFGQSGYGKELSAHAIDEYSQFKHVMMAASL